MFSYFFSRSSTDEKLMPFDDDILHFVETLESLSDLNLDMLC